MRWGGLFLNFTGSLQKLGNCIDISLGTGRSMRDFMIGPEVKRGLRFIGVITLRRSDFEFGIDS